MNRRTHTALLLGAISMAGAAMAESADNGGRKLQTTLTGAAEVPGPGDTDGRGTATVTVNHGQARICYEIVVSNIAAATAAHIHRGSATVAGPVVVGLQAPADGDSKACVDVNKALALEILKNPAAFYVNVHNADFPGGAVRGQLAK